MNAKPLNLIDRYQATVSLMAKSLSWRIRAVDDFLIDSATSCAHKRSLQCGPLRNVLQIADIEQRTALIALNVASLPKGPLLKFDVHGPLGDAWLLPRTEIAKREVAYLATIARDAGLEISEQLHCFLVSILDFVDVVTADSENASKFRPTDGNSNSSVAPTGSEHAELLQLSSVCQEILSPFRDGATGHSVPENPMSVVSSHISNGESLDLAVNVALLKEYVELLRDVEALRLSNDERASGLASEFLDTLADYAFNYDLIVAMEVPLDQPFLVKFSERRPIRIKALSANAIVEVLSADCISNHIILRVNDANVYISELQILSADPNTKLAGGAFVTRKERESVAVYAYDVERDYRISLKFQLSLFKRLKVAAWVVVGFLLGITVALWLNRQLEVSQIISIVGPSSLAPGILLTRESSTLGSRLRRMSTLALIVVWALLLASALFIIFVPTC